MLIGSAHNGNCATGQMLKFQRRRLCHHSARHRKEYGFDGVYAALGLAAETIGKNCKRADDIWNHDAIIKDVVSLICKSSVVICDLTGKNANVFYEAGIAHSMGKNVILITQSADDVPFDLRHLRFIQYLNNREGLQRLTAKVIERLENLAAND